MLHAVYTDFVLLPLSGVDVHVIVLNFTFEIKKALKKYCFSSVFFLLNGLLLPHACSHTDHKLYYTCI